MSDEYLLDTNIVSETTKPAPSTQVVAWLQTQKSLILSAVSVYELARGVERMSGRKRIFLDGWLAALLSGNARIISFDRGAALEAAALEREARRRGRPIPERDLFIIATAKSNGLRLATRNLRDFRGRGVSLYNPFEDGFLP
jgi:toxin FitB